MGGLLFECTPRSSVDNLCSKSSMRSTTFEPTTNHPLFVTPLRQQNALIERESKLFTLRSGQTHVIPGKARHRLRRSRNRRFFRCDIFAVSAQDDRSALTECKQLVIEAGGSIMNDFEYLGGFLFELPPNTLCPLETGDLTANGGSIVVESWQPFCTTGSRQCSAWKEHGAIKVASSKLGGKFDDLLRVKKRDAMAGTNGGVSILSRRESMHDCLTLVEMLLEGQVHQNKLLIAHDSYDDPADWETLFEDSEDDLEGNECR